MAEDTTVPLRFAPERDLVEFRSTLKAFLAAEFTEAQVRTQMETTDGYRREDWVRLCQLGVAGLAVPEEFDGSGGGVVELAVAFEEFGRCLAGVPALAVTLSSHALLLADDAEAAKRWLPQIVDGATIPAFVWADSATDLLAGRDGDSYVLDGSAAMALDAHSADVLLVVAGTASGSSLFVVERGPGVDTDLLPTLDLTRKFSRVELRRAPATLVGVEGAGHAILDATLDVGRICLAAEQLGGAEACLASSLSYAKTRFQFGRAIGSYQAIKHRCVDVFVQCESLRSAVTYGAWVADHEPSSLPRAAALAKATGSDTYRDAAEGNVQVHGGIGFTWEHPAHLYLKRAKSSEIYLGKPASMRRRLAESFGW